MMSTQQKSKENVAFICLFVCFVLFFGGVELLHCIAFKASIQLTLVFVEINDHQN